MFVRAIAMTKSKLDKIIDRLREAYGTPARPHIIDPFELILYENVSYLVDDDHRRRAFENLKKTIGTRPEEILTAKSGELESVAALGGSDKKGRVEKLVRSAQIAIKEFGGDIGVILTMPFKKAVAALKKFPSIGEPGAEKILLFCGNVEGLPLESNGLRVLMRIGYATEEANYTATYRKVRAAISDQIVKDADWLVFAHLLLRQHGQQTCKRTQPLCKQCVIIGMCNLGQMNVKLARG